jgi:hypothetical protein
MQRLCDSYTFRPIGQPVITESASGNKVYKRTGVFQNHKKKNCNGRVYPESIWKKTFAEGSKFRNRLNQRAVLGLLEHPKDGQTRLDYGPAILITDAHIATSDDIRESIKRGDDIPLEEGDIMGTFEILGTAAGKELQALDEAGVTYGVSSRGTGTVKESDGAAVVQEDFDLETWDAVYNPSVERALPARTESSLPLPGGAKLTSLTPEQLAKYASGLSAPITVDAEGNIKISTEGAASFSASLSGSSAVPAKEKAQPTNNKPMTNKLTEMRSLESQIVQLTATNAKGLNVPAKASLLNMQLPNSAWRSTVWWLKTHPSQLHAPIGFTSRLNEFEKEVAAGPAPCTRSSTRPGHGPESRRWLTPADDAAPEGDEVPEDELLRQAAEMLHRQTRGRP